MQICGLPCLTARAGWVTRACAASCDLHIILVRASAWWSVYRSVIVAASAWTSAFVWSTLHVFRGSVWWSVCRSVIVSAFARVSLCDLHPISSEGVCGGAFVDQWLALSVTCESSRSEVWFTLELQQSGPVRQPRFCSSVRPAVSLYTFYTKTKVFCVVFLSEIQKCAVLS